MARRKTDRTDLEARLGHRFGSPDLLERALTHVSAAAGDPNRSNQRLEFLGDRVLGLAVAEMLHATFPSATEGELSHRLSELVRREACAALAERWGLGPYLHLGSGENRSGGRRNVAILADAAEAVLGAVYLDGGFPVARALVERSMAEAVRAPRQPAQDPKTALQEWAQGRGLPTPRYVLLDRSGPDHAPRFAIRAEVTGQDPASGTGRSKREAERDAARAMLLREGVWTEAAAPALTPEHAHAG
ncbi:MAG: ribonuclease III [Methylobacteriaceae bacterium]|nr:ribonuclease III [Methylobacteriaceae bacterium]